MSTSAAAGSRGRPRFSPRGVPAQLGVGTKSPLAGHRPLQKVARPAPSPEGQKPKLLDQVRTVIRTRHYSVRTEEAYIHWIKRFISMASATP